MVSDLGQRWVARVAEELASPAMGKLVDDMQTKVNKRKYARAWLAETLKRNKNERWWTNARSWVAIVLSVLSLITAIAAIILRGFLGGK